MNQQRTAARGFLGQHGGRGGVDAAGQVRLAFGFVHSGVSGGVDDDLRLQRAQGSGQAGKVGQIAAVHGAASVKGHHIAQHGEAALQLPAELAVFA